MLTYAKAALPLIPGASRLPFVAGGGGAIPEMELQREVAARTADVAAYSKVCGFTLRDELPPTYPHILAFPLHMQLMTDGRFPLPAVGLVHLENRITLHRPLHIGERFDLRVRPTPLEQHPKGRTFSIVTEAWVDDTLVWEEKSTMLRRGKPTGSEKKPVKADPLPFRAEWRLPGDLGRRYAAVSGDSNPIHMHPLSARLFGFPRAIAHGMWTKARALASLELPESYTVEVAFKRPILLPGRVELAAADGRFEVRGDGPHLEGSIK